MTLKPRVSRSAILLIALAAFIAGGLLVWFFKPQSNNFAGSHTANTKTSVPIMKKVIAYKIHLPISADGEPTRGKVEYQLDGETTFRFTKALAVSDVAALSSILVNDDVYFDDGLKEFIRTGKPINAGVQP